ncbi:hypothetical protein BJ742DRAFT_778501 [Cladochytrium replicatum]|nr:hypothetical protein BJ742DRAFT_778501 [Cladochytrium replicatum]
MCPNVTNRPTQVYNSTALTSRYVPTLAFVEHGRNPQAPRPGSTSPKTKAKNDMWLCGTTCPFYTLENCKNVRKQNHKGAAALVNATLPDRITTYRTPIIIFEEQASQLQHADPNQSTNFERAGAIVGCLSGFIGGSVYFFAIADIDPCEPILGMDPSMAYSIAPFLVGGVGVGLGMSLGGISWRAVQKFAKRSFSPGSLVTVRRNFAHRSTTPFQTATVKRSHQLQKVAEYRGWLRRQRRYRAVTAAGGVFGAEIGALKLGNSALRPAKVMGDAAAKAGSGSKSAVLTNPAFEATTTKPTPNLTNRASKRRV